MLTPRHIPSRRLSAPGTPASLGGKSGVPGIHAALASGLVFVMSPLPAYGTPAVPTSVVTSAYSGVVGTDSGGGDVRTGFTGVVLDDNTAVRAGPGENRYATLELDRGTVVVAIGLEGEWLRILPPGGSYCVFPRGSIELADDGRTARVVRPDTARVGSRMSRMQFEPAAPLSPGAVVHVIGQEPDYVQILPPPGTHVYVHRRDVAPGDRVAVTTTPDGRTRILPADELTDPADATVPTADATVATVDPIESTADASVPTADAFADATIASDAPTPPDAPDDSDAAGGRASGPVAHAAPAAVSVPGEVAAFDARLRDLESRFAALSDLPIDRQEFAPLREAYERLAADAPPESSARQIAEYRVEALRLREEARRELAEAISAGEASAAPLADLRVEGDELARRVGTTGVRLFTAVGTLRASAVQWGDAPLYRLVDPASNRTLVYVRGGSPDASGVLVERLGQFVAVRGDITDDTRRALRYVTVSAVEPISPEDVYETVNAPLVPASIMRRRMTAGE